ncbi:MAG: prepilin peptidase [Clostridia bacterium]|nr:prepilin peptidase [Clostridia bacterium]
MSIYDSTEIFIFFTVLAAFAGCAFGSFLNCAAWRIARGESFIKGKSRCPSCSHELGFFDLIPVLSWIFLGGKCRYCKAKVSFRYPLTELFFGAVTVICLLRFDLTVRAAASFVFLCCLFCLSLTDLDSQIIPDGCIIISAAVWLVYLPFSGLGWGEIGLCVLAGIVFGGGLLLISLIMDKVLKRESMGGGDIKLFFVTGLWLGFVKTLFAVILSCFVGLLAAFIRRKINKDADRQFPFGPSIAFSAAVMLFWGDLIAGWYMGLLGL